LDAVVILCAESVPMRLFVFFFIGVEVVFKDKGNVGRETVRNASAADDVEVDRAVGDSTLGSRPKRG
jgi:hypothetical protein